MPGAKRAQTPERRFGKDGAYKARAQHWQEEGVEHPVFLRGDEWALAFQERAIARIGDRAIRPVEIWRFRSIYDKLPVHLKFALKQTPDVCVEQLPIEKAALLKATPLSFDIFTRF